MVTSTSFLHHQRLASNAKCHFKVDSFKSMWVSSFTPKSDVQAPKLRALSIFSGVAGLELGLKEFDPQPSAGQACVFDAGCKLQAFNSVLLE